jgi:DNA-binding NarL/FixJ family response regulator
MSKQVRVLIIDDNHVIRHALAELLRAEDIVEFVETAPVNDGTPLAAIESHRPALVVLRATGPRTLELTHVITRRFTGIRIVILGLRETPEAVTEVIEAGAIGYVPEDASVEEFCETIRLVARGETRVTPRIAATLALRLQALASTRRATERAANVRLTPRETEILGLVAEGMTNKQIAARLHVEEQTIKNHIHNILERLNLRRRTQAVQFAWETGMLRKPA